MSGAVLAAVRPADVNVALFFHILGAMLLVGTLLVVASAILAGWRRTEPDDSAALTRFGLRSLVWGVLPSYVLMRIGAQWTEAAFDYPEDFSPAWLGIGYVTADAGALLILVSIVLAAVALRRMRAGGGTGAARAVGVISVLLLVVYLVAVWAMSAKPD